eukprot:1152182-Pelagomonas_calceolata.AAC.3
MSLLQLILIPCQSSAWACRRSSSNLSSVQDFQLARGSSGALSRTSSCSRPCHQLAGGSGGTSSGGALSHSSSCSRCSNQGRETDSVDAF